MLVGTSMVDRGHEWQTHEMDLGEALIAPHSGTNGSLHDPTIGSWECLARPL